MEKKEKRDTKANYSENVLSPLLCERIRYKLKLTKEQLSDTQIRETVNLSNEFIGDWIVNNADGYIPYKNCGQLIVSKHMPYVYREKKYESIEDIENNPRLPEWRKASMRRRFEEKPKTPNKFIKNPKSLAETFFYTFKVMWFNKLSCDFDKAELYTFDPVKSIKQKLAKKIRQGKDYFEWDFKDFEKRGEESLKRNRNKKNSPTTRERDLHLRKIKNRKRGIK